MVHAALAIFQSSVVVATNPFGDNIMPDRLVSTFDTPLLFAEI